MPKSLKSMVKALFLATGLEVRRASPAGQAIPRRDSIHEVLLQAKARGFSPGTIIDVGAAYGSFAEQCAEVFPEAQCILVEPLCEYQPLLERLVGVHPRMSYVMAAAGESSEERYINVHPDLVGSSLYREVEEGSGVNGSPRCIPTVTVDELVRKSGSAGPFLLKADVQGAELDVLRGADKTLRATDYVLLEVSFFKFFHDGPECCDVLRAMKERGFVPYEIFSFQYRPLDNALSQVDIAFVRENGLFRHQHHYATPEQRARQNERMQDELQRRLS